MANAADNTPVPRLSSFAAMRPILNGTKAAHERGPPFDPSIEERFSSARKVQGEHVGIQRMRLPQVVDTQAATRHHQLEPTLRIGENSNVLQGISIDDEEICRGSRSHHADLSLHAQ